MQTTTESSHRSISHLIANEPLVLGGSQVAVDQGQLMTCLVLLGFRPVAIHQEWMHSSLTHSNRAAIEVLRESP